MTPTELYTCIQDLYVSTEHNNLKAVIARLKPLDKDTRKKVVNTSFGERTVLFLASLKGYLHFVNYYIDECGADLEQKGIFEVQEDHTKHSVTPLWAAAVNDQFDVVKALIYHGADINGESDTKSTPVRSACYMSNIKVVRFLIACGADISKSNVHGGTCLINSIQSEELCQLLLDKGADVNARDQSGNTALHYAIKEGRIGSTRLLVDAGSDVHVRNELGDDSLQTACLRGFEEIVEYLIEKTEPCKQRVLDSYEVMGANFIDEKHDINQGLAYWRLALGLRASDPVLPKPENRTLGRYFDCKEFQSFDELNTAAMDPDEIYLQSLMVRQRVLGPTHKDTAFGLMYRGAVYADTKHYKKCIDIWTYALETRHEHCEPLSHETVLINMHSLTKLFWELWLDNNRSAHKPSFENVHRVVAMIVDELRDGKDSVLKPTDVRQRDYVKTALSLSLHLVNLIIQMTLTSEEEFELRRLVHRLIRSGARTSLGHDILHLVCDHRSSHVDEERCSMLANLRLLKLLIECGADLNATDTDGNTPLHMLALSVQLDRVNKETYKELATSILDCGAHFDTRNHEGFVVYERLNNSGCTVNMAKYTTLKCLAARCIMENELPYEGEVPRTLEPFITLH